METTEYLDVQAVAGVNIIPGTIGFSTKTKEVKIFNGKSWEVLSSARKADPVFRTVKTPDIADIVNIDKLKLPEPDLDKFSAFEDNLKLNF